MTGDYNPADRQEKQYFLSHIETGGLISLADDNGHKSSPWHLVPGEQSTVGHKWEKEFLKNFLWSLFNSNML